MWGFPGSSVLKNLPANAGAGLTEEPGGLQSIMEWEKSRHDLVTKQQQYIFMYSNDKDRWMGKKAVVHIHNRILLSY